MEPISPAVATENADELEARELARAAVALATRGEARFRLMEAENARLSAENDDLRYRLDEAVARQQQQEVEPGAVRETARRTAGLEQELARIRGSRHYRLAVAYWNARARVRRLLD
jgi:regulator of replication initiation timing